jgi:hypothetical protein
MPYIYSFILVYFILYEHSFIWPSKWADLSQHLVKSLHYFCHTHLIWLVFKPFYCCFSRIAVRILVYFPRLNKVVRPNGRMTCIQKEYGRLTGGDLISPPIDENTIAYVLCGYLLRVQPLYRAVTWRHHRRSRELIPAGKERKHTSP